MLAVSRAEPDSETILTLKRVYRSKKKSWQLNVHQGLQEQINQQCNKNRLRGLCILNICTH